MNINYIPRTKNMFLFAIPQIPRIRGNDDLDHAGLRDWDFDAGLDSLAVTIGSVKGPKRKFK